MSRSHAALPEELFRSQPDASAECAEYRQVKTIGPAQCRSERVQSRLRADTPLLFHGPYPAVRSPARLPVAGAHSATANSPMQPLPHRLPIFSSLRQAGSSTANRLLWDVLRIESRSHVRGRPIRTI